MKRLSIVSVLLLIIALLFAHNSFYHPLHFQNSGLWSGGVESVLKSC